MKAKWFFNLVALCVLSSLALTACGSGATTATSTAAPKATAPSATAPEATSTVMATETTTAEATSTVSTSSSGANSCPFTGTWSVTHAAGPTQFTAKFMADASTLTVDRTGGGLPDAHIDGTFTYDPATSQMVMKNTASQTADAAFDPCIGVVGTYTLSFPDCTHFVLTSVSDACGFRVRWANGTTLTKQP